MAETPVEKRVCVIAVDGSKHSDFAIRWYKENMFRPGDQAIFVHSVDHRKMFHHGSAAMAPGNPDTATHAYAKEDEKANKVLEKIKQEKDELGIEGDVVKMIGEPGHCIIQKANECKADFIVTGCRGAGTLRRTFMGSVSDYVMHHSDVPVFVCRH